MDILARGAAGLLMVAAPLALAATLVRRLRTGWRLILIGAATFILAQVAHIPFNSYVLNPVIARLGLSLAGPGWQLAGAAILLGLSAGLFEEGARWMALRFWIRKARSWNEAVTLGAGHGGAEALILGLLGLATLVQLTALRGQDLSAVVPPEQLEAAEAQIAAYWGLPAWAAFFAPVERALTIAIQVSLSAIVLQAFIRRGGVLWLLAAIGWHALVDAVAVYAGVRMNVYGGSVPGIAASEAILAVLAALSLVILFGLRRDTAAAEAPAPPLPPLPHAGPVAGGPIDPVRLEDSRFSGGGPQ